MIRRFARPYARALSELVTSPAEARKAYDELAKFEQVRRGSDQLAQLFDHPGIDPAKKGAVIRALGSRLHISEFGYRVLDVLVRNHRINHLGAILEAWRDIINRNEGVSVAEVRVAHSLNHAEQEKLRKALEKKLGRRVELQLAIDPSLLGGFIAKVGSEVYDASVTGRIERFRQALHR